MNLTKLALAAALLAALLQISGCHYYLRATPTFIISDEPINLTLPQP